VLENALVSKPRDDLESAYIQATTKTQEAVNAGAEEYAATIWEETANRLERSYPDEPEARGWILLARAKAQELRTVVDRRTKEVEDLLAEAAGADAANRPEVARNLRQRVLKEYEGYRYLGHLLNLARQALEPSDQPEPEPPADEPEPLEAPPAAERPGS
jgi:hypothetical protein